MVSIARYDFEYSCLYQTTMQFAHTRFNDPVKAGPFSTMTQRNQVLSSLNELFLAFIAQRIDVVEPGAQTSVITVRWLLESIEFASLDENFVCMGSARIWHSSMCVR